MLAMAIVFGILACVVGGWVFLFKAMPPEDRPRLAYSEWPLMVAVILGVLAVVLFFFVKWYAGILGLLALVLGCSVFAALWYYIYRLFRL